jgi:uncharacterized protein YndB with AHSA1/START domain
MSAAPFELSLDRFIAASPETCWKVWTQRTVEWFAPKPWTTKVIEQDFRAGGRTALTMTGPDGNETPPMEGVILECVPNERLVTTDAFAAGWIPQKPFMTAIWAFAPEGEGTRYTATVRHWDAESLKQHEEMGFHQGWGIVADQFKALCEAEAQ